MSHSPIAPSLEKVDHSQITAKKKTSTPKLSRLNRKAHRWIAIVISIPMLFIILTGIFLQLRKPVDWIQPPTAKGSQQYQPTVVLEQVLDNVKAVPSMGVSGWSDIKVMDLRPKKGIIKVRNFNELETQVDATTGEVLQTAQRRNDFVVKWHDFSAWKARLWLGLPIRLAFLGLFLTGVWLNIKMTPARVKQLFRKKPAARKISEPVASTVAAVPGSATLSSVSTGESVDYASSYSSKSSAQSIGASDGAVNSAKPKRLRLKAVLMKYHYWLGWVVIIPWAFVIFSGLLLQVRYEVPWVMPPLQTGVGSVPQMEFVQVLEAAEQVPSSGVEAWEDVWRMYVYPNQGVATIRAQNKQETQIDSQTGEVLQVATRRTDWLEDLHEGKWMGLNLKLFLPVHILSLILWLTGTVVAFNR
ncbi:MAG: PepSY-associated TM helix domain-containing protein [Cyanobacteria bacterium J06621_3]